MALLRLESVAMSLRAAQKQMTYELFLAKALELFGEKGYSATTIDDIASGCRFDPDYLLPALPRPRRT